MYESKNGERGTDGRMRPRNGEENGRVQTVRTACQENLDFIPSRETVHCAILIVYENSQACGWANPLEGKSSVRVRVGEDEEGVSEQQAGCGAGEELRSRN